MFGEYKFNVLLPSQYHSITGLYPTWVGYLTALQNYECKPRTLDDYFIIFVSAGKGMFRCRGIEYQIEKHDAFFLFPGIVHYYKTDPENLLELWWVGFNGPNALKLLNDLNLNADNCIVKSIDNPKIFVTIKDIVDSSLNLSSGAILTSSGSLYKLFGQLMDLYIHGVVNSYCEQHNRITPIERALSFIDTNYPYEITVEQMALFAGLSRAHFSIRFKSEVGCSPSEHLAKIRLMQAKHYLSNSNLTIKEVAHSTGFKDSQYFSRFFKKHEGVPPLEFRHIHMSKNSNSTNK